MLLTLSILFFAISLLLFWLIIVRPIYTSPSWQMARERGATVMESLKRFRTIAAAKLTALVSMLLPLYDVVQSMAGGIDWTPVTSKIPAVVWPFITLGLGLMFLWLRKITSAPPPTPGVMLASAESAPPATLLDHEMAGKIDRGEPQ